MEFHGKVIAILDIRRGVSPTTGNSWASQDFVVEKDGRYPTRICFNVFGEQRIAEFNLQVGEFVTVHFDISARCNNNSWFNDVSAYRVERGPKQHVPVQYNQVQQTFEQIAEEQQQQQYQQQQQPQQQQQQYQQQQQPQQQQQYQPYQQQQPNNPPF